MRSGEKLDLSPNSEPGVVRWAEGESALAWTEGYQSVRGDFCPWKTGHRPGRTLQPSEGEKGLRVRLGVAWADLRAPGAGLSSGSPPVDTCTLAWGVFVSLVLSLGVQWGRGSLSPTLLLRRVREKLTMPSSWHPRIGARAPRHCCQTIPCLYNLAKSSRTVTVTHFCFLGLLWMHWLGRMEFTPKTLAAREPINGVLFFTSSKWEGTIGGGNGSWQSMKLSANLTRSICILQMEILGLSEEKHLKQNHPSSNWQSQDLNQQGTGKCLKTSSPCAVPIWMSVDISLYVYE